MALRLLPASFLSGQNPDGGVKSVDTSRRVGYKRRLPSNPPMQKKSPLASAAVSPRALVVLLVCAATCLIVTRTLPAFPGRSTGEPFRDEH